MHRIGWQTTSLLVAVFALTAASVVDRPARGSRPIGIAFVVGSNDAMMRRAADVVERALGRRTSGVEMSDPQAAMDALIGGRARMAVIARSSWEPALQRAAKSRGLVPVAHVAVDGVPVRGVLVCRAGDPLAETLGKDGRSHRGRGNT